MRFLLSIITIVSVAWFSYWFVGSSAAKIGFETWFQDRRDAGWVAEYSALTVRGFPYRFDTTFTTPALADPGTGLAWEAPFFQLLTLSYKPNHLIAVWPDAQLVATPLQKYDVTSTDMRASLIVAPKTDLALERLTLTAETLTITAQDSDNPTLARAMTLAAEKTPDADTYTYRLGFAADGFQPSLDWVTLIDPSATLPDQLDALNADVTVTFDKPWDISAIERARPQPRTINIRLAEARWGRLALQAAGQVTVDDAGTPTGQITIKARNWRDIVELARTSGTLPDAIAGTLEDGLGLLSQLAGNPKTLDIPLDFRGGRIWIGPVPLTSAPNLALR